MAMACFEEKGGSRWEVGPLSWLVLNVARCVQAGNCIGCGAGFKCFVPAATALERRTGSRFSSNRR
ncbi:MAG: hypothetical protein KatS3mg059_1221 [Thermomicrobiales bacterium]|nr:MAG: hypothetical protein KatS3mg059_1221 [Thermomicrobiales bacterium]